MLVAMSSSETLLLVLAMNFAHTVLHPLLLFLTTSVQDMLMLFSDPDDPEHEELIGSSQSTTVDRVISSSPISCGIRKSGLSCRELHVLKYGDRSL